MRLSLLEGGGGGGVPGGGVLVVLLPERDAIGGSAVSRLGVDGRALEAELCEM